MKQKVNYPLFPEWNTEEIIQMCAFYSAVEKAYYKGVQREEFSSCYKNFLKRKEFSATSYNDKKTPAF